MCHPCGVWCFHHPVDGECSSRIRDCRWVWIRRRVQGRQCFWLRGLRGTTNMKSRSIVSNPGRLDPQVSRSLQNRPAVSGLLQLRSNFCRQWHRPAPCCLQVRCYVGRHYKIVYFGHLWLQPPNIYRWPSDGNHLALRKLNCTLWNVGDRGGTVVKVLCYKSEGRWFDASWCHWNFSLT